MPSSSKKLPTTGYEEIFGDPRWNSERGIRSNNCYSYAMGHYRPYRRNKAVVGDLAGYDHDIRYDSCAPLKERILKDNPKRIYEVDPKVPCKDGFYKIMMFVSTQTKHGREFGDFHFYKQHRDVAYNVQRGDTIESIASFFGIPRETVQEAAQKKTLKPDQVIFLKGANVFSHKLGWATGALLTDSCGKRIDDPRKACRAYGLTYDSYCGSYCVRARRTKTSQ
jgi:hypothetical protein